MKASVIFILFLFISVFSFGQTEKGNILLGGSISYSKSEIERNHSVVGLGSIPNQEGRSLTFNPGFSYFIIDRLSVGLSFPINNSKFDTGMFTSKTNTYSIGPNLRYYFHFNDFAVFPFFRYTKGFGTRNGQFLDSTIGSVYEDETDIDLQTINAGLGLAYFFNKNISIELLFSYQKEDVEYEKAFTDYETTSNILDLSFQIYLNPKSKE